jgi:hypothetical protein
MDLLLQDIVIKKSADFFGVAHRVALLELAQDAQDAQVPPAEAPAAPKPSASPQRSGEVRPRTIWAYWAQGHQQMPQFFQMCVATWQRVNPHWDAPWMD